MSNARKAVAYANVEGVLEELFLQSHIDNIYVDNEGKTLRQYLSEQITSNAVTAEEMTQAISNAMDQLINGAPEAFDTLKEIADWIEEHEDLYEGLVNGISEIKEGLEDKVDKESGKGLSSNDYTTADKNIVQGVTSKFSEIETSISTLQDTTDAQEGLINTHTGSADIHVTAAEKTKLNRKQAGSTVPEDLQVGEIFFLLND